MEVTDGEARQHPARVQFWLGDGCFFGMCAIGDGWTYGFGNVARQRRHDPVEGRLERLRKRFAEFGPAVREYLGRLQRDEQIHCSPIEWVEQERWHGGLATWAGRRRPRVGWVQRESRAVADGLRLPPRVRDDLLRRRGDAMLRQRFAPLVEGP